MKQLHHFTAVIEREGNSYVALPPELDIASQGDTVEEARKNLVEAIELFLEAADPSEVESRLSMEADKDSGLVKAIYEGRQSKFIGEDVISTILED